MFETKKCETGLAGSFVPLSLPIRPERGLAHRVLHKNVSKEIRPIRIRRDYQDPAREVETGFSGSFLPLSFPATPEPAFSHASLVKLSTWKITTVYRKKLGWNFYHCVSSTRKKMIEESSSLQFITCISGLKSCDCAD